MTKNNKITETLTTIKMKTKKLFKILIKNYISVCMILK